MRYIARTLFAGAAATCLLSIGAAQAANTPKLKGPVLITSLGQSPDAKTLSVLANRAKMTAEFVPLAKAADVAKFKSVFVVAGVSLKGFGSAGVNIDTETKRCEEIVKTAKSNNASIILVHIGGEGRRDSMTNLLLDKLAPHANAFIVYENGNGDGYFTKAAKGKALDLVPKTLDVIKVLEAVKP